MKTNNLFNKNEVNDILKQRYNNLKYKFIILFDNSFTFYISLWIVLLFYIFYLFYKSSIFIPFIVISWIWILIIIFVLFLKLILKDYLFFKAVDYIINSKIDNFQKKELNLLIIKYFEVPLSINEKKKLKKEIINKYKKIKRKNIFFLIKRYWNLFFFSFMIAPFIISLTYYLFFVSEWYSCTVQYAKELNENKTTYWYLYYLEKWEWYHIDKELINVDWFVFEWYAYWCINESNKLYNDYYNTLYCLVAQNLLKFDILPKTFTDEEYWNKMEKLRDEYEKYKKEFFDKIWRII